jgi:hypothetical protein
MRFSFNYNTGTWIRILLFNAVPQVAKRKSILLVLFLWIKIRLRARILFVYPDTRCCGSALFQCGSGSWSGCAVTSRWILTWKIYLLYIGKIVSKNTYVDTKVIWKARNRVYLLMLVNLLAPGSGSAFPSRIRIQESSVIADSVNLLFLDPDPYSHYGSGSKRVQCGSMRIRIRIRKAVNILVSEKCPKNLRNIIGLGWGIFDFSWKLVMRIIQVKIPVKTAMNGAHWRRPKKPTTSCNLPYTCRYSDTVVTVLVTVALLGKCCTLRTRRP